MCVECRWRGGDEGESGCVVEDMKEKELSGEDVLDRNECRWRVRNSDRLPQGIT